MCLRQTSSLLLFYAVGKYCEMTIKTGLVYDGIYKTPKSTNLQNIDGILFAHSGFVNSNPMPR